MKQFNVKLTKSEISHLQGLIIQNEDSQTYHGNWEQYYKRQNSIKRKFLEALSESQSVSDNETKKKICHAEEDGISHNACASQPSCDECSSFR